MVSVRLTGGMTNIILQSLACIAYAKKWNMPYALPTVTTNKRWKHYTFPGFHYEDVDTSKFFHYREPAIEYDKRPYDITFQDIPYHENILLEGHFLSHKYWHEYQDKLFPLFGFNVGQLDGWASIHSRRKDYLNMQQYLPCVGLEYYQRSIDWVVEHTSIRHFLVFGDDPNWNIENINKDIFPQVDRFEYSVGKTEQEDMEMMASCGVNIIANSTYSLMAHHLSRYVGKICIAPKNWYGEAFGEVDKRDMYAPGTILL